MFQTLAGICRFSPLSMTVEGIWETEQVSSCQTSPPSRAFSNNYIIMTNDTFRSSPVLSKNDSPSLLSCQQWVSVMFWIHQHPQATDLGSCVATSVCQSHLLSVCLPPSLSVFSVIQSSKASQLHVFDRGELRSSDVSRGNWELQYHLSETVFRHRRSYIGTLKISLYWHLK